MGSTYDAKHWIDFGKELWREIDQDTGELIASAGDDVLAGEIHFALLEYYDGELKTLAVFAYKVLAGAFEDELLERNPNRNLFIVRLSEGTKSS